MQGFRECCCVGGLSIQCQVELRRRNILVTIDLVRGEERVREFDRGVYLRRHLVVLQKSCGLDSTKYDRKDDLKKVNDDHFLQKLSDWHYQP